MIERQVQILTSDGDMTTFVCHPERNGPHPLVIFFMDAPGMVHDWHLCVQVLAEARSAIAHIGAFVREVTRRPTQLAGPVDAAPLRIPG